MFTRTRVHEWCGVRVRVYSHVHECRGTFLYTCVRDPLFYHTRTWKKSGGTKSCFSRWTKGTEVAFRCINYRPKVRPARNVPKLLHTYTWTFATNTCRILYVVKRTCSRTGDFGRAPPAKTYFTSAEGANEETTILENKWPLSRQLMGLDRVISPSHSSNKWCGNKTCAFSAKEDRILHARSFRIEKTPSGMTCGETGCRQGRRFWGKFRPACRKQESCRGLPCAAGSRTVQTQKSTQ